MPQGRGTRCSPRPSRMEEATTGVSELDELLARCRDGDALAWEALVRATQGRVYGLALHYLRSAEEARDLAQEVYVKLWRKLDRHDGGPFLGWLLTLTRNACIDRIRMREARPPAEDVVIEAGTPLRDERDDPEQAHQRSDRQHRVRRALAGLGGTSREVLMLKEIQGLDLQEIADQLGVPVGTVKSRAHRARQELARRLLELDPTFGVEARP